MDINKRVLRKITIDDCIAADEIFAKLMGDEVEPRRQFIEENARFVDNLDIQEVFMEDEVKDLLERADEQEK